MTFEEAKRLCAIADEIHAEREELQTIVDAYFLRNGLKESETVKEEQYQAFKARLLLELLESK